LDYASGTRGDTVSNALSDQNIRAIIGASAGAGVQHDCSKKEFFVQVEHYIHIAATAQMPACKPVRAVPTKMIHRRWVVPFGMWMQNSELEMLHSLSPDCCGFLKLCEHPLVDAFAFLLTVALEKKRAVTERAASSVIHTVPKSAVSMWEGKLRQGNTLGFVSSDVLAAMTEISAGSHAVFLQV